MLSLFFIGGNALVANLGSNDPADVARCGIIAYLTDGQEKHAVRHRVVFLLPGQRF